MRIIFMGNPEFAVPSLEQIAESNHEILYVVSNPPKQIGRGRKISETAVSISAKAMSIPVLQPPKLNDINFLRYISLMQPDIFVVVAYKILPYRLLSIPRFGAINLHPSLLPKYRGAAPIQWAIFNGEKETAVTTISLSKKVDSGVILLQDTVDVFDDDNFGTLSERLSKLGAEIVVKTLDGIESNKIVGTPQDETKVTKAPKINTKDLEIDWNKSATEIHNQIRAFSPYPAAFTTFGGKRLKIFSSSINIDYNNEDKIGKIIVCTKNELSIQTGKGLLNIHELQLEGKKRMDIISFLNGVNIYTGTILGK
jgi:methionyl-tRNA formyltransferase